MKFPNHIILDLNKPNIFLSSQYWIFKYFHSFQNHKTFLNDFSFHKIFLLKKESLILNKFNNKQIKFTVKYSETNASNFLNASEKKTFLTFFTPRPKVKHKPYTNFTNNQFMYHLLNDKTKNFDVLSLKKIMFNFKYTSSLDILKSNSLWTLFNINFLRKEKMYTKLKYSRTPQYDIVSGGAAALLAGFLGFLITEKFGFELVDSGDFYFLFMYFVFLFFSLRLFLKIINYKEATWNFLSFKWLINFYRTLVSLIINLFIK